MVAGSIASGLCSIDETEERILCFVGIWNIGYGVIRGDEEGQNQMLMKTTGLGKYIWCFNCWSHQKSINIQDSV